MAPHGFPGRRSGAEAGRVAERLGCAPRVHRKPGGVRGAAGVLQRTHPGDGATGGHRPGMPWLDGGGSWGVRMGSPQTLRSWRNPAAEGRVVEVQEILVSLREILVGLPNEECVGVSFLPACLQVVHLICPWPLIYARTFGQIM